MQKSLLWLTFLGLLFLAQACQPPQDVNVVKSQIEMAFPVLHAEMSIQDMIGNSEDSTALRVYPDNTMSFIYEGELFRRTSEDILGTIPEDSVPLIQNNIDVPLTILDGVDINVAQIKSGFFQYRLTNDSVAENLVVHISVPQLVKDGQAFTVDVPIPYYGSLPVSARDSVSLAGYNLDVSNDTLSFHYAATNESSDTVNLTIFNGSGFPTNVNLKDIVFGYVEGHWNPVVHDFAEQTIKIDFFENNYVNGEIYFDDPKVDFSVISSFGLPVRTKLNYFRIIELDGSSVDMVSQKLTDGIDFEYPKLNEVGQTKTTQFSFDKTNSNIAEILNTNPVRIEYDIDVTVNPDNLPDAIGFATDSSYFSMLAKAELPLIGKVNHFVLDKDYDVDFSGQEAKEAVLKLSTDNEIPLEVAIQMYFLDANGVILDSLHNDQYALILAAADFPSGAAKHHEIEFPLETQRWDKIKATKKIRVKGNYTTSQNGTQSVTFKTNQKTKIKVGLKLKL